MAPTSAKSAGKGDLDKLYKKLVKNFKKQHVHGKHSKGKKINHRGDFYNCYFKSIRISGAPKGSRIAGSIEGQIKGVVRNVEYEMTGTQDQGKMGVGDFLVTVVKKPRVVSQTGKEEGKEVLPHHVDGQLEIIEVTECKDEHGNVEKIKENKGQAENKENVQECKDEQGNLVKIKLTRYLDNDGNVKKIKVTKSKDQDGNVSKIKVLKYNDEYGNTYSESSSDSEKISGGEDEMDIFTDGMWLMATALMNDINMTHMRMIATALIKTSFFPIHEDMSEDEDDDASESSSSSSDEDLSEDENGYVLESSSSGTEYVSDDEDGDSSGRSSSETDDQSEDEDDTSGSSGLGTASNDTIYGQIIKGISSFFQKL